jgi:hypothetical protein
MGVRRVGRSVLGIRATVARGLDAGAWDRARGCAGGRWGAERVAQGLEGGRWGAEVLERGPRGAPMGAAGARAGVSRGMGHAGAWRTRVRA